MATERESTWKYLKYVTLLDAWRELWAGIVAWALLTAIFMVGAATAQFGISATESWWSDIPDPVLYFTGFAVFTWLTRGESLSLAVPETVKGWLVLNVVVLAFGTAAAFLPGWVLIPAYTAVIFVATAHESLCAIGRRNYEQLNPQGTGGV